MLQHRGVTHSTMDGYERYAADLIEALGVVPAHYSAAAVRGFVIERCDGHKVKTAQSITTAVRAFLRFLAATGQCCDGLRHAVPRFACYQLAATPRFLEPEDLEKVIDVLTDEEAVEARNRAVVLLLARLGLRASEVAELTFDAVDWQNGRIAVCGKGRRQHWLPLPQQVGDAMVTYLRRGRPPLPVPQVFISALAPLRPMTRQAVSDVVRRALRRAGIKAPHHGAHLLRHSAATAMLRNGVSLAGIGSVLRHRSPAYHRPLRQDRLRPVGRNRPAVAAGDVMLSDHVERYLTLRRTIGYKLLDTGRHLQAFARFASDKGDTHVRAATAVEWAAQASSPLMRHVRLHDVVLLARFLYAEDTTHEIPPARYFQVRVVRQPPYIYAPAEIGQLLAAAHRLPCSYALRRPVYATLIGLLAATGLRVSEALDLRFDDLLPSAVLRIRQTKFAKSRLVPLHATTVEALTAYLQQRRGVANRRRPSVRDGEPPAHPDTERLHHLPASGPTRRHRSGSPAPSATGGSAPHLCHQVSATLCGAARFGGAPLGRALHLPRSRQPRLHLLVPGGDPGTDGRHRHRRREPGCREVGMTPIAPLITHFLRDYLPVERGYSPHTCESYAYAFRLLFTFAADRLAIRPSQLHLEHLDAPLIVAFLTHFEVDRGGSPASRNVRLAAVKSFHALYRVPPPGCAGASQADPRHPRQAP